MAAYKKQAFERHSENQKSKEPEDSGVGSVRMATSRAQCQGEVNVEEKLMGQGLMRVHWMEL